MLKFSSTFGLDKDEIWDNSLIIYEGTSHKSMYLSLWFWKIFKSPSAEVPSSLLLCSFPSFPILVRRKMGGTWEEHGRNMGGTIRMCGRAFLWNVARLRFTSLRSSPSGFTDKVASVNESFGRISKCKFVRRTRTQEIVLVVYVRSSSDGNGARLRISKCKINNFFSSPIFFP